MDLADLDTLCFRTCRTFDGSLQQISTMRRNGKIVPIFSPSWTNPPNKRESCWEDIVSQEKLYVNLTATERRTWRQILRGQSIRAIARDEGVSRAAIYGRIIGNSKGQGGMIAKNYWILIWWLARTNTKHDDID